MQFAALTSTAVHARLVVTVRHRRCHADLLRRGVLTQDQALLARPRLERIGACAGLLVHRLLLR